METKTLDSRSTNDLLEHAIQFEVKKRPIFQVKRKIESEQVDQKLEFPRNRLILDETIGEGEFGRVKFKILQTFDLRLNVKISR